MEIEWVQCREREPTNVLVRIEGKGHRQRRKVLLQARKSRRLLLRKSNLLLEFTLETTDLLAALY